MTPLEQARGLGLVGIFGWLTQAPLWWHVGHPTIAAASLALATTAFILTVRL